MTLIKRNFPGWANLSDFFDDDWLKPRFNDGIWMPAINIVDNEDNYEIEVAAPGFTKEEFNVKVDNGMLTISGTSKKEEEEKTRNFTRKEFSSKAFTRSFTLPENVTEDDIAAKYRDGVLRLTLKKSVAELPPSKEVKVQ